MKFTLRRVVINHQGYELPGGFTQWGVGAPLYVYEHDGDQVWDYKHGHIRAYDRDDAKAKVRAMFPGAKFYN